MKHLIFVCTLLFLNATVGIAQDPHFSQYFASPVTLNPANAGTFDGTLRVAANYRTQWWGVGNPFTTATISAEGFMLRNRMREANKLAFSLTALNDASSAGALKSTYLSAGLAYHLALDENGDNTIGLGFTATYAQKRLDYSKLTFASQFMSGGFNTNIASGEGFAGTNSYTNFNVGSMYQFKNDNAKGYFGIAACNFLDEKLSFNKFAGYQENIAMRYTVNAGFTKTTFNEDAYSFSANYNLQAGATDAMIGGAYSWLFKNNEYQNNYFTAGAWYRVDDAVIPYIGLTWSDMQLGFSYDIITSNSKLNTPKNGSMEVSLIFTGKKGDVGVKCPPVF
jgi:type IX secretion system PorP/SprF family membrane protein